MNMLRVLTGIKQKYFLSSDVEENTGSIALTIRDIEDGLSDKQEERNLYESEETQRVCRTFG